MTLQSIDQTHLIIVVLFVVVLKYIAIVLDLFVGNIMDFGSIALLIF